MQRVVCGRNCCQFCLQKPQSLEINMHLKTIAIELNIRLFYRTWIAKEADAGEFCRLRLSTPSRMYDHLYNRSA